MIGSKVFARLLFGVASAGAVGCAAGTVDEQAQEPAQDDNVVSDVNVGASSETVNGGHGKAAGSLGAGPSSMAPGLHGTAYDPQGSGRILPQPWTPPDAK